MLEPETLAATLGTLVGKVQSLEKKVDADVMKMNFLRHQNVELRRQMDALTREFAYERANSMRLPSAPDWDSIHKEATGVRDMTYLELTTLHRQIDALEDPAKLEEVVRICGVVADEDGHLEIDFRDIPLEEETSKKGRRLVFRFDEALLQFL